MLKINISCREILYLTSYECILLEYNVLNWVHSVLFVAYHAKILFYITINFAENRVFASNLSSRSKFAKNERVL